MIFCYSVEGKRKYYNVWGEKGKEKGKEKEKEKKIKPTKREQRIAIFIFFGDNNYLYDTSPMDI